MTTNKKHPRPGSKQNALFWRCFPDLPHAVALFQTRLRHASVSRAWRPFSHPGAHPLAATKPSFKLCSRITICTNHRPTHLALQYWLKRHKPIRAPQITCWDARFNLALPLFPASWKLAPTAQGSSLILWSMHPPFFPPSMKARLPYKPLPNLRTPANPGLPTRN